MSDIADKLRAYVASRGGVFVGGEHYVDYSAILCREAAEEIDRLRAIVGKLPKTKDGVPVVPGMSVWLPGYEYPGYVEYLLGDDLVAVNDMNDWPAKGCDCINECTVRHPSTLYSTSEAALAANERSTT